ncbi:MAG: hypothetical protein N3D78_00510, partial [Candidatus Aenigmarchaeota archaeon]|nr:hypothetical protein [Candidatus Aenigmarchaeota archaeon]
APGFGKEAIISLEFCDEIIIVSNPTLSSYFDSLKCFQIAKNLNKKVLGVIINKFEKNSPVTPKDFEMVEGLPIIGVIKESKMAKISEMRRSLLYDLDRNFKKEIDLIVSKITGFEVRESGVKQKIMNIFSWIR